MSSRKITNTKSIEESKERLKKALFRMEVTYGDDIREIEISEEWTHTDDGLDIRHLETQHDGTSVFVAHIPENTEVGWHTHAEDETIFMLEGEATVNIETDTYLVKEGEMLVTPKKVAHNWKNVVPCKILMIFRPRLPYSENPEV